MSVTQAREFLKKIAKNPSLAAKVEAEYVKGLMELAANSGQSFSEDDLKQAMYELASSAKEIDDADLDAVAGGAGSSGPSFGFGPSRFVLDSVARFR